MNTFKKKLFRSTATALIVTFGLTASAQKVNIAKEFKYAETQTNYMLAQIAATDTAKGLVSPRTFENGKFKMVNSKDWTSGFFPGILWFLYDFNRDPKWLKEAKTFTAKISKE